MKPIGLLRMIHRRFKRGIGLLKPSRKINDIPKDLERLTG